MEHLNHISINIRGLNSDEKRNKLYEWLKIIKCDIAFIQETHFIECKKDIYKRNWDGIIANGYSDSQFSRGVSILFKVTLDVKIIDKHASNDGRIIVLNVMIQGKYITYINVYAPNDEKSKHVFLISLRDMSFNMLCTRIICTFLVISTAILKKIQTDVKGN